MKSSLMRQMLGLFSQMV